MSQGMTIKGKTASGQNVEVLVDDTGHLLVSGGGTSTPSKPTDAYAIANIEETGGFKYFGFEDKDGNWYIMRKEVANNQFYYVAGENNYATAWTNKDSQVYDLYSSVF